jgi:hypothetical protein
LEHHRGEPNCLYFQCFEQLVLFANMYDVLLKLKLICRESEEKLVLYTYIILLMLNFLLLSLARIVVLVLWSTISAITVTVISVTRSASLLSRHTCRRGQLICWKKVYWTSNEQIYYGELVALTLFMRIDQSNGASTNQSSTVQKKIEGLAFSIWTPCRWWYNISAKLAYHLISYLLNRRAEQRHESMTTQSIALSSW